jgi:ABC-type multidrug transport system permease subunit
MQGIKTHTPDFDIINEIPVQTEAEALLGMENTLLSGQKLSVNIPGILISALIFLVILAWFEFVQTAFYSYMNPEIISQEIPAATKFWTAILFTFLVAMLLSLVYYYCYFNKDC